MRKHAATRVDADEAQKRVLQEELERKLIEGLESGNPIDVTSDYLMERVRLLRKRHEQDAG